MLSKTENILPKTENTCTQVRSPSGSLGVSCLFPSGRNLEWNCTGSEPSLTEAYRYSQLQSELSSPESQMQSDVWTSRAISALLTTLEAPGSSGAIPWGWPIWKQ